MLTQPDLFQPGHRPDIPGQLRKTARTIRNCPACPDQPENGGIAGIALNVRGAGVSCPVSGMTSEPSPGDVRMHRAQRYVCIGMVDHHCADGRLVRLARWESHCAVCAARIEFLSPLRKDGKWWPNRRCPDHRNPGARA